MTPGSDPFPHREAGSEAKGSPSRNPFARSRPSAPLTEEEAIAANFPAAAAGGGRGTSTRATPADEAGDDQPPTDDGDDADDVGPDPVAPADLIDDEVLEGELVDDDDATDADDDDADDVSTAGPASGDVAALTTERDEYLGALQRLQADFENFRKRVERQREEQSARAATDLVTKLLPVLDTLDLARDHMGTGEGSEPGVEGQALLQSRSLLLDVLAKEGLERVDEVDVAFDPLVHDAVAHGEGREGDDGVLVDDVMRAGYRWRGQVVRPAMVKVRG